MSPARRVVRQARDRLLPLARLLPPGRGPARVRRLGWSGRVASARAQMRTDPQGALAALQRVLGPQAPPRVWRTAAEAAARAKEHHTVVELDRRGVELGYARISDVLRLRKASRAVGDEEAARLAEEHLLLLTPARPGAVKQCAPVLAQLDPAQLGALQALRARTASSHPGLDLTAVDDAVAQVRLRGELADGHVSEQTVLRALEAPGGATSLVRSLLDARLLDELQSFLARLTPQQAETVPVATWRRVARRAAPAGWTELAGRSAAQVLAAGPDDEGTEQDGPWLHDLVAQGRDQEHTMAEGWTPPARHAAGRTDRDPRSVVSVLGQSLPLRSGGYATRSHGILTSLVSRGWHMNAVTRLGFPYDLWWATDDDRTVHPVDTVDGVPYHRLLHDGVRHYPRTPLVPYVEDGARGIAELARSHRASLVHASSLYDVGMAGLLAAREVGVPFVYEMRGLKQLLESARQPQFADSPRSRYLDLLEGTVAREADALFVITAALGRQMVDMGVDPRKITVVPNGVNAGRFRPRPRDADLADRLGVTGKTVIGYAGGLVHYEGLDLLFEAAALLRRTRDDFHVLVVGDGAHQRALHRVVDTLGVQDLVTFTGRVPHDEVEEHLSVVDITPFPRKPLPVCELISPIKPFEAMAMEKAVVASDVAALAEIVQDGVTGRLFAKGDAEDLARVLGELLDDPEQRLRLGRTSREWVVEERDWSRITDAVDGVYRQLLADSTES
ncbi:MULTISPECIES: glycosyltransferase family 4 protein [unclassified Ornithinimicrobium]|uniref:glycosyltransferase family 4 protein n=1 Tax=unclassified Ornithinimicrobium TaxID=2615080 RepID=UPI003854583C